MYQEKQKYVMRFISLEINLNFWTITNSTTKIKQKEKSKAMAVIQALS